MSLSVPQSGECCAVRPLKLRLQFLLAEVGLKFVFDVKTTLNISDITFYPSRTTHGYDVYASAANKEDILFLNLENGELKFAST